MAQFFTDFSEYAADAQPSDWTDQWSEGITYPVKDTVPSGGGSQGMLLNGGPHEALVWDEVGTITGDIELLVKWRTDTAHSTMHQGCLHVGGTTGQGASNDGDAYYAEFSTDGNNFFRLRVMDNGGLSWVENADTTITYSLNTWYWLRIQRTGTTLRARQWEDGTSEPGTWDSSGTGTQHSSGKAGVMPGVNIWIAQFGVGTGGDEAPASASASGSIAATLPSLTAALAGEHAQSGALSSSLSALTASFSGVMVPDGVFAASLPSLTASLAGEQAQSGALEAELPAMQAAFSGTVPISGTLAGSLPLLVASFTGNQGTSLFAILPSLTAAFAGAQEQTGALEAQLPALTGSLEGSQEQSGSVGAELPALQAAMSGSQLYTGIMAATLPMLTAQFAIEDIRARYPYVGRAAKLPVARGRGTAAPPKRGIARLKES